MQLTSLKSPGCLKRCELDRRETQEAREEVGETEAMKERRRGRESEGASGGEMKVNVTNVGEERGVFDLTNRDSKTLQLALLLAVSCHCAVPCKRLRDSSVAMLHLLKGA